MNFNIQPIGIESVDLLLNIAQQAYLDHYKHLWKDNNPSWYIQKCFTIEPLLLELSDPNNAFFLIFKEERLVGFLKLIMTYPLILDGFEEQNALYLERIYFIKEAVGQGLGDKICHFAIEKAQKLDKKLIWLAAMDSSLKPIAFYERMGFEICGRKRLDFEQIKDEMRGMVVMKRVV